MAKQNDTDDLTFSERLELLKSIYSAQNGSTKPPADDETYAVFTSGDYADREFKRIARPSYRQQKQVEEVRLSANEVCFRMDGSGSREEFRQNVQQVKENICKELGWEAEEKISWELSGIDYHKKILPLIVREELPEGWDIEDTNGFEIERMLRDFLLGT